jgi:hypothetical protein
MVTYLTQLLQPRLLVKESALASATTTVTATATATASATATATATNTAVVIPNGASLDAQVATALANQGVRYASMTPTATNTG